jgi:hypothetical protein
MSGSLPAISLVRSLTGFEPTVAPCGQVPVSTLCCPPWPSASERHACSSTSHSPRPSFHFVGMHQSAAPLIQQPRRHAGVIVGRVPGIVVNTGEFRVTNVRTKRS